MDVAHVVECTSPLLRTSNKPAKKPLKGCLKSPPPTSSSPLPSPGFTPLTSPKDDTFASFAQACADLQTLRAQSSELNLAIPVTASSNSSSGSSSPLSDSCESSGASSPITDGSLTPRTRARKNVSFCAEEDGLEEVFIADVWDRTPTEPAGHLSYQDLLELKAIQRTLPRAQQLPDLFTGKPAQHFLQHVPISLLPLTDQSSPSMSPFSTPHPTPVSTPTDSPNGQGSPSGSADRSPPRSPICSPSLNAPSSGHGAWHSYTPSTMSPLSASALAAAFASKNAEKRSYPNNPIPSNLGPKFVPPSNPHVTVTPENSPTPSIPSIDSPPTPKSSATTTATSSPVQSATPTSPSTHNPFSLAHLLPSKTSTPMRRKPNFAFLPLLDTPPSSGDNTPTPTICTPTAMIPKLDLEPEEANKSLASPIIHNENSSCDDEQPLAGAYSSSSSSYTSDSERESSSFYTDGSPLSRSTSMTSVSTSGSVSAEVPNMGAAYTEELDSVIGLFIPSLKRTQLPKHAGYFGNDVPFVLKDPRLQAVSSPVLAPPSPLSLDGEVPSGTRSLDADLATIMQARLELVEREQSTTRDVLEYTEPITRTPSSSRPYTNPQIDGAPASPESSQENTEKTTDWEEVERFRRRRLGNKWTPPSSQGPSRTSSRAPSRERNVVEINGVEIELDGDN